METMMALFIGIGLSATCGFRIFVPLLGMSIAHQTGHLALSPGFEWIGSWPASTAFAVATVIEVGGYYIPWVDNLLDSVATPGAVVAGTIVTASVIGYVSPFLRWSLALIAGGGAAGVIQSSSVLIRGVSTASTGAAGNPAVSTLELLASIAGTVVSILLPVIAIALVVLIVFLLIRRILRMRVTPAARRNVR